MPNQYKNKVIYGDQTLMDITDTTATVSSVLEGQIFYGADGARNVGAMSYPYIYQDEEGYLHIPAEGWVREGEIIQDEDGYVVLSEEAAKLLLDATGVLFGT